LASTTYNSSISMLPHHASWTGKYSMLQASSLTRGRLAPSERGYALLYQVEADQLWWKLRHAFQR